MKPVRIIDKERIILAGFSFYGDPFQLSAEWTEENEIGRLWKRFGVYMRKNGQKVPGIVHPGTGYELHIYNEDTETIGHLEVFSGMELSGVDDVPHELSVKILPPVKYAVFTLKGKQIISDWNREIYQDWLPGSGYVNAQNYNFQYYDERFKGMENVEDSVIDVYIPVK